MDAVLECLTSLLGDDLPSGRSAVRLERSHFLNEGNRKSAEQDSYRTQHPLLGIAQELHANPGDPATLNALSDALYDEGIHADFDKHPNRHEGSDNYWPTGRHAEALGAAHTAALDEFQRRAVGRYRQEIEQNFPVHPSRWFNFEGVENGRHPMDEYEAVLNHHRQAWREFQQTPEHQAMWGPNSDVSNNHAYHVANAWYRQNYHDFK